MHCRALLFDTHAMRPFVTHMPCAPVWPGVHFYSEQVSDFGSVFQSACGNIDSA